MVDILTQTQTEYLQNRNWYNGAETNLLVQYGTIKANSHIACYAHAVPLPCHATLIYTCHAVPLRCSDSAMSFMIVCMVAGNIRTASPTVYHTGHLHLRLVCF